jgi:hypothetical protein
MLMAGGRTLLMELKFMPDTVHFAMVQTERDMPPMKPHLSALLN